MSDSQQPHLAWLRVTPADWKTCSVWMLFRLGRGRVISLEEIYENPGDYPVYSSQTDNDGVLGRLGSYDFEGDYLTWTTDGANAGTVFVRSGRFNCTNVCGTLFPKDRQTTEIRYFRYALNIATRGMVRYDINPKLMNTEMAHIRVPCPPIDQQRGIADFLDRETAGIDALLKAKRNLIERFQEKRRSYIADVCLRGLDRSVPTQASKIPTIGQVPMHWKVVRNKILFREIDERSVDGTEELLTVSHITGVTRRSEKPEVTMFMAESLEGYKKCRRDDLIINTMWAWMGALGISGSDGIVSPGYNVYRFKQKAVPKFFDLLYRTPQYISEFTRWSKGVWESRLRLYPFEFLQILTPVPPLDEQQIIVDAVERETGGQLKAIATLETSISKLAEYRLAVISAAVTGQIDVDNYRPQEAAVLCQ